MSKKFSKPGIKGKKNRQSIFTIVKEAELFPFLIETIKDKTRTKLKAMLTHQQIKVGKEIITQHNHPLKIEDKVTVSWDGPFKKENYDGIKIVFEDDDIIVINKRSGLLSVGSEKEKKQTAYRMVTSHIQNDNPVARLFVVHRLDREASGLMVFTKNKNAQEDLKASWVKTHPKNIYLAVTEGTIEKDEDTIISYLRESKALIVHSSKNPKEGKKAVTHYKVIKKNEFYTLLEAWQETTLKNQLRAQLKSIGHPVIGDKKYEAKTNPIQRAALHLRKITFIHPVTLQEITFETKVPEDFLMLFRQRFYK
ncbi:MAG: RNA pseudouridine synthase [Flavobacteriales bacterium CG_4_10_14_0_2_um_filter_32_8]|nr:MAG: RNA pseudouridine synthase [Flavobacteriales bacterium CG_4_10_14_0_2_um_filter_32_8]